MVLLKALLPIARDLAATFVFVILFWTTDIYIATAVGMALIVSQTLWMKLKRHPIGALQWLSLALIAVFGGATILFHNQYFIMLKPSLLWLALGAVMLRREWMAPYLPPIVTDNLEESHIVQAGYAYAGLMFALAVLNTVVVRLEMVDLVSAHFWAAYALIVPPLAQLVLIGVLYALFRKHIAARIRSRAAETTALPG